MLSQVPPSGGDRGGDRGVGLRWALLPQAGCPGEPQHEHTPDRRAALWHILRVFHCRRNTSHTHVRTTMNMHINTVISRTVSIIPCSDWSRQWPGMRCERPGVRGSRQTRASSGPRGPAALAELTAVWHVPGDLSSQWLSAVTLLRCATIRLLCFVGRALHVSDVRARGFVMAECLRMDAQNRFCSHITDTHHRHTSETSASQTPRSCRRRLSSDAVDLDRVEEDLDRRAALA